MAELYRYAAFISYSSKDAAFAKRLHRALESFGIPLSLGKFDLIGDGGKRNRIYPVFRDREELSAGQLGDQIEANLKSSAALIVVCSPNGAASPWVQKEIEFFAAQGRRAKIFAIIADTAPLTDANGGDATLSSFPPAFRGDALAGDELEPLAADARKGKDGFRNAWLKIVAGMVGVSPGQIIDRDRARRTQRALLNSIAALTTVFGIGLIFATQNQWRPQLEQRILLETKYKPYLKTAAALADMKDGAAFQECGPATAQAPSKICPVMVLIPGGEFRMGDAPRAQRDENNRPVLDAAGKPVMAADQRPLKQVARFAVSQTEVTFDQWAACVAGGGCKSQPTPGNATWRRGDRPVINVSWTDAQEYVKWLKQTTGAEYRLLSEPEWEYAARGGTTTFWSFRDDPSRLGDYAWFTENSDGKTQPVRLKKPNPFGLYDVHGNVWEWVEDCWGQAYASLQRGESANDPPTCSVRVVRGGSWFDIGQSLRSANRERTTPNAGGNIIGFRVARTVLPPGS